MAELPEFLSDVVNPLSREDVPSIEIPRNSIQVLGGQVPPITGRYTQPPQTNSDFADALVNHLENPEAYASDKYKYGKNYAYDADHTGANFERYYKAPRVFKQIGFSPWRDNETLYNEKMTWFDDWKRAAGQSAHLGVVGAKSMLPWNAWDMDQTDSKSAEGMERAHAIGFSGRKGVGGFLNDMTLDAGYTLGIGAEIVAEELATWATAAVATPFTEGGSLGIAAGKAADNLRKGYKAWDRMSKLKSFGKAAGKTSDVLDATRDIGKMRQVFNYAKSGRAIEDIVKVLTPATATFGKDLYKSVKNGHSIKTLAVASRGVGSFYRDARELAAAISESKLEGGSVEMELVKKLTDDYYAKNGFMPDNKESDKIASTAANAGAETFLWNLPALWISNKIVFDTALKGLPSMRALRAGSFEIGNTVFNRTIKNTGTANNVWEAFENTIAQKAKNLKKGLITNPKGVLKKGIYGTALYSVKNVTEGAQELYQDSASVALKNYYTELYSDPLSVSTHTPWEHFGKSFGELATSKQGAKTFMSGFLMGAMVQVPQHIVYGWGTTQFYKLVKSEDYKEQRNQETRRTNRILEALNEVGKDPMKFHNDLVNNLVKLKTTQKQMIEALENKDMKLYKDLKTQNEFQHIFTLMEGGKMDVVKDYLTDLKTLSGDELTQAFGALDAAKGDPKQHYDNNINDMLQSIEIIKDRQEYFDNMFDNPFDPFQYSQTAEPEKYAQEANHWAAFQEIRRDAILNMAEYSEVSKRIDQLADTMSRNPKLALTSSHDLTVLLDEDVLSDEIQQLGFEIGSMDTTTGEGKREQKLKLKRLNALSSFRADLTHYKNVEGKFGDKTEEEIKERKEEAKKQLHKSYSYYIKSIAKENSAPLQGIIDESFEQLEDYMNLRLDQSGLAKIVELIHNPKILVANVQRLSNILSDIHSKRVDLWKIAIKKDFRDKDFNSLLNQLDELGVFLDDSELEPLKDRLITPKHINNAVEAGPVKAEVMKKANELIHAYITLKKPEQVEEPVATTATTPEATKPADGIIPTTDGSVPTQFILNGSLYAIEGSTFTKDGTPITLDVFKAKMEELKNKLTPPAKPAAPAPTPQGKVLELRRTNKLKIIFSPDAPVDAINYDEKVKNDINTIYEAHKLKDETLEDFKKRAPDILKEFYKSSWEATIRLKKDIYTNDSYIHKTFKDQFDEITTAGVFTPTTPFGTPTGPELTTATSEPTVQLTNEEIDAKIEEEINELQKVQEGPNPLPRKILAKKVEDIKIKYNAMRVSIPKVSEAPIEELPPNPEKVAKVKESLKKLNEKTYVINPADKNTYVNANDPSDVVPRVSTLKGKLEIKGNSADRGSIIDSLVREFFSGDPKTFEDFKRIYNTHEKRKSVVFTDPFIRDIFNILTKIKQTTGKLEIITNLPKLWGTLDGRVYAGEIDLLGINKQGDVYIIDLKTSSADRRIQYKMEKRLAELAGSQYAEIQTRIKAADFNDIFKAKFTPEEQVIIDKFLEEFKDEIVKGQHNTKKLGIFFYAQQDSIQQSAYAELLRQRTGISVKNITIFPIQVTEDKKVFVSAQATTIVNKKGDTVYTMVVPVDRNLFPEVPAESFDSELPVSTIKVLREVTAEDRGKIRDLGFTSEERNKLTDEEVISIVDNETTPEEYRESIQLEEMKKLYEKSDLQKALLKGLQEGVDAITTYDELQIYKAGRRKMNQEFFKAGIKGEEIDAILEKREQELLFTVTFDELKIGDIVLTKQDKRTMVVAAKEDNKVVLNPYNNPRLAKMILTKDQVSQELLFKDHQNLQTAVQTTPMSQEDIEVSNASVASVSSAAADILKDKPLSKAEIKAKLKKERDKREKNCKIE